MSEESDGGGDGDDADSPSRPPSHGDVVVQGPADVLCARQWGAIDSDHVVFFLHGTPGCRLSIWPREPALREQGIRVITYDRPGYGRSPSRPGRRVVDTAAEVRAIADHFGLGTFGVVGRSGGGPSALACGARLPDRVTRVVTLAGLAPYDAPDLNWHSGMLYGNSLAYLNAHHDRRDVIIKMIRETYEKNPETLFQGIAKDATPADLEVLLDDTYRGVILQGFKEALTSTLGWMTDWEAVTHRWGFEPREILRPTRLWHGVMDVFSPPRHSQWLANIIPSALLLLDEKAGHFRALKEQNIALLWASSLLPQGAWCSAG